MFSTVLLAVSLIFQRGALPVALIVLTGYASIGLLFFSNLRYSEKETEKIDRETEKISLEINQLFTYNQQREEVAGKKPRKVSNKEKNL